MCKSYDIERPRLGAQRTITVAGAFTRVPLGCYSATPSATVPGLEDEPQGTEQTLALLFEAISYTSHQTLTAFDRINRTSKRYTPPPHPTHTAHGRSEQPQRAASVPTWESAPAIQVNMMA
ncbi:MAG: hypothetical protein AAFS10_00840 [Myxococcota bacterium]